MRVVQPTVFLVQTTFIMSSAYMTYCFLAIYFLEWLFFITWNLLESTCNKKFTSELQCAQSETNFNILPSEWTLHLKIRPLCKQMMGKAQNTDLRCEKACMSSEIFLKSWSFVSHSHSLHSLTHSLAHSLSLTHSLTHSVSQSLTHSLTSLSNSGRRTSFLTA